MNDPAAAGADVFVVGSLNADVLVSVQRRPQPGETILGGDAEERPGGKGANQAVAAARLDGRVAMLGCVGDDAHGQWLVRVLRAEGVDATHVRALAGVPTGRAVITITPDGENAIIVAPGANGRLTAAHVDDAREAIGAARVIVTQLEVPLAAVDRAVRVAAAAGVRVVLNLAPATAVPLELLQRTDVLVVNEHEAGELLGATIDGVSAAMGRGPELVGLGPRAAVITLGAAGAVTAENDRGVTHVPSPTVLAIDATGAGDAFVGALAVELAAGSDLPAATQMGVRAGAAATLGSGAQPALPTRADLERLDDATPSSTASRPAQSPTRRREHAAS